MSTKPSASSEKSQKPVDEPDFVLKRKWQVQRVWKKLQPKTAVALFLETTLVVAIVVLAQSTPLTADSTADWLVASAARDGADPYVGLRTLSSDFGVPYSSPVLNEVEDQEWVHPRTPAALLVLQPSTLLDPSDLLVVLGVITFVGLGVMGVTQLPRIGGRPWHAGLLLAGILAISAPVVRAIQFGSWSVLIAVAIGGAWVSLRDKDGWLGGVAIGLTIGLRIFPGLLLVPLLLFRRVRAMTSAILTAAVLNLIGVMTFGIPLKHALENLSNAGDIWIGISPNGSLVSQIYLRLGIPAMAVVAFLTALIAVYSWWLRIRGARFDVIFAVGAVAMLLISPLSWDHYDALLIPVATFLLGKGSPTVAKVTGSLWMILLIAGFMARQLWEQSAIVWGMTSLFGRLLLLGGLLFLAFCQRDPCKQFVDEDGRTLADLTHPEVSAG